MDATLGWWLLAGALMLLGLAGSVLPLLPGTLLVLAGTLLGAWIDDFQRVGALPLAVIGTLALLSWALDYLAGVLGAKRFGASREAVLGAALGTLLGLFGGLLGLLLLPLAGALTGEWLARRDHRQALRAGFGTWVGMAVGLLAKVVLAFVMIGVFVAALLW